MDLWVVSLISNPHIKLDFYTWTKEKDEAVFILAKQPKDSKLLKKSPLPIVITNTTELIINGLFSDKGQTIRKKFQESLEMVCERVKDGDGEQLLFWLINILIDHSPVWDGNNDTK